MELLSQENNKEVFFLFLSFLPTAFFKHLFFLYIYNLLKERHMGPRTHFVH